MFFVRKYNMCAFQLAITMVKIQVFIQCFLCVTKVVPYRTASCDISKSLLTSNDKCSILFLINEYRNEIANGERPPVPKISDMMKVHWDESLSMDAMDWLNANCKHGDTKCIGATLTEEGSVKGEANVSEGTALAVEHMLSGWSKGKFNYSNSVGLENMDADDLIRAKIKYYVQLLSARSTRVGCGAVIANTTYVLLCYFDPPGVLDQHTLYRVGIPGSHCPEGSTVSNIWPALCTVGTDTGCLSGAPEDDAAVCVTSDNL